VGDLRTYELVEQGICTTASDGRTFLRVEYAIAEQDYRAVRCYAVITRVPTLDRLTKEYKMRGFVCLGLGVLLLLAWGISYIVFHVTGVLIHLLLIFALISFMIYVFIGKRGVE
jgi:hypothetical protein